MKKVFAALNVLRYGVSVADPVTFKNRQNLFNALIGLLGALVVFLPVEVTADDLGNIAGGIAALVGLFNVYGTYASTDKIGLWPSRKSPDSGVHPGAGELSEAPRFQHPYDNVP